ncbi:hypothetical protein L195_g029092, partial [Trifolium pratense]
GPVINSIDYFDFVEVADPRRRKQLKTLPKFDSKIGRGTSFKLEHVQELCTLLEDASTQRGRSRPRGRHQARQKIQENIILVMDQPSTSKAIVKHSKDEDKGNGQSTKTPMDVELAVDFRPQFTTDRMFKMRKQMQDWVYGEEKKLGFSVVVAKSDNGGKNRKPFVVMGCQRGGTHKAFVNKKREATTRQH